MFVAQVLRNEGYVVMAAADLQEALNVSDLSTQTGIDLILTDIMLPTSNGMEIAQALVAKRPNTPVLYMSGAGSDAIHAIQFEGAPIGEFLAEALLAGRCWWARFERRRSRPRCAARCARGRGAASPLLSRDRPPVR